MEVWQSDPAFAAKREKEREPMRAVVYDRYGPPDVVRLAEVEPPVPKEDETLVKIHATTITRVDCATREANSKNEGRKIILPKAASFVQPAMPGQQARTVTLFPLLTFPQQLCRGLSM